MSYYDEFCNHSLIDDFESDSMWDDWYSKDQIAFTSTYDDIDFPDEAELPF